MEKLNSLEEEIGKFIENDNFKLVNTNVASQKVYKYAYEEFKNNIRFPKEYIDFYYKDNKKFDFFYSKGDKEKYYKKWLKHVEE